MTSCASGRGVVNKCPALGGSRCPLVPQGVPDAASSQMGSGITSSGGFVQRHRDEPIPVAFNFTVPMTPYVASCHGTMKSAIGTKHRSTEIAIVLFIVLPFWLVRCQP